MEAQCRELQDETTKPDFAHQWIVKSQAKACCGHKQMALDAGNNDAKKARTEEERARLALERATASSDAAECVLPVSKKSVAAH